MILFDNRESIIHEDGYMKEWILTCQQRCTMRLIDFALRVVRHRQGSYCSSCKQQLAVVYQNTFPETDLIRYAR
jgi:hypothetical protein